MPLPGKGLACTVLAFGFFALPACANKVERPAPTVARLDGPALRIGFDDAQADAAPGGFRCAAPGPAGAKPARWLVVAAADAPSPGKVLIQADNDETNHRYPVALHEGRTWGDVRVEVKAKAISGGRDRSFGVVVRAKDERNYYVARANTSGWGENVRFYRFVDGVRTQLDDWDGTCAAGVWHTLSVDAVGDVFTVTLDGKPVLRVQDGTFPAPGLVGVWTKAESVSAFDDLTITPLAKEGPP